MRKNVFLVSTTLPADMNYLKAIDRFVFSVKSPSACNSLSFISYSS